MLQDFLIANRDEIIKRAQVRVKGRPAPLPTTDELVNGVPLFLTQLGEILAQEAADLPPSESPMEMSAGRHGADLLQHGFTISQVVHDYGDVCQSITELALDLETPIGTEDFRTLNRCLDDAIASAVTQYARGRDLSDSTAEVERRGFFAHELRNHLNTATLAYQAVKSGKVGVTGSTVEILGRSLRGLRQIIDRSVTEVRLNAGTHHRERIRVAQLIEEVEIDASLDAASRDIQFSAERVDNSLLVDVDRHLFASAISNLLQNAFKFTRPSGHVWLRVHAAAEGVIIQIEDECGGIQPGTVEAMFQPFEQRGTGEGLGLGLAISRQAIESDGGKILHRNIPGKGCIFTVEMPVAHE